MLEKLKRYWAEKSRSLDYTLLIILVVVGLMNIVHNLTFQRPTDGAEWAEDKGKLVVLDTDKHAETRLQIGDVLLGIDDQLFSSENAYGEYLDYLYELPIGSKHLYILERSGNTYEPWVTIRGLKDGANREYYLYAVSGFVYLIFLLLILSQDVIYGSKRSLITFCFFVFLTFVFHPTDRFALLDWISFALDEVGMMLLPSALAGVALNQCLARSRWLPFLQALHWIPSLLLMVFFIHWLFLVTWWGSEKLGADFLETINAIRGGWGGALIIFAVLLLIVLAEMRGKEKKNFSFFWAVSWVPFALTLWRLDFPSSSTIAGIAPLFLPLALVFDWSRRGDLYLGDIGKKVGVYFVVVFALLLGYFVFLGIFQVLLGARISSDGQTIVLGIGIMFAAISYSPLKRYVAELMDRLIYGKRFESIKVLSDFSGINRADTNIDEFLYIILTRIKKAFALEKGMAFKVGEHDRVFKSIDTMNEKRTILFDQHHPELLAGEIIRGHECETKALEGEHPFLANDYICPIRVTGKLTALIAFSMEGGDGNLSPEELRLLESLLNQCNVLMENMDLYQAVNQKAHSIMQLKEYNENIIESSRIGILTTDEMGRAVSCNSALAELAGLAKDAVLGKTFEDLFHQGKIRNQRQVRSGFTMEGDFTNGNGQDLILETQRTPLKTKENVVYGTLYLVEDIREKKKVQEQLQQQEKLASIGLLAAGVAHEINTPLTGITSYSQILVKDADLDTDQKELLSLIMAQSQRAANIVNELLNFSRKESAPKGAVDLLTVLNQTLRFLSHQIQKHKVQVTVREPSGEPLIEGYANQIQQVFVNLIVNAMDAMPEGGRLEIGIVEDASRVVIWFRDSGVGMDMETRTRIFDPFFTTKEVGKGTGLGLSVVFNILQDHGASVDVKSRPEGGTTFTIQFPARGKAAPQGQGARKDEAEVVK